MGGYAETFRFGPPLPRTQEGVMRQWSRAAYRKEWHKRVWVETHGRVPVEPLRQARLTLIRGTSTPTHRLDADNVRISFKPLIDGLVESGVLVDDNMGCIGEPVLEIAKAKRGKGWVEIRVEEVT